MRLSHFRLPLTALALVTAAFAMPACGSSSDETPNGGAKAGGATDPNATGTAAPAPTPEEQIKKILDARKTDYGEALRTASLKLRDRLPDLSEIKTLETGDDAAKKVAYEKLVDDMLASPEFSQVMIKFWQDTFRTGQVGAPQANVDRDAAATFAAQVVVEGRSYGDILTATTGTCPTYDATTNAFTAAECKLPTKGTQGPVVGILTDPGLLSQYFANLAFRRVRFIQETFVCTKFPAEFSAAPVPMGNGVYTAALPFTSITGKQNTPTARVDFQDTKAVVCANCHANLNHVAPLFINYDENGALMATPQVKVPIEKEPFAARTDYLPDAETLKWRSGVELTDIASLGKALVADPDVAKCAVNRVWNFAMSRGDIVNDLASVPDVVTQPYVDTFKNGMKFKETIRAVFKSEDFTKF